MPNLDNLRKQAKQFLRWHRDRHYPVAAEIRAWLPRFQNLGDPEILDAPFKLGDAQQLVARRLVKRDRARLCLRLVCEPVFAGDIREREQLLSASIAVETATEIKELFRGFQATGVDFFQTLKTEPWGARTFIVRDPDGNLVLFAGPGG
jgi:uncharacterized glyoxalase superfamily protein PhnB